MIQRHTNHFQTTFPQCKIGQKDFSLEVNVATHVEYKIRGTKSAERQLEKLMASKFSQFIHLHS